MSLAARLIEVIEDDVLPLTRAGVARGSKVFGAAVLRADDLSLVLAETNDEAASPLWHGEVHALKRFFEMDPARRPAPADCLFLSTHEPCSMCASALAWAGMRRIVFLFPFEETRDGFGIPHDLAILRELFGVDRLRRDNAFWTATPLADLVEADPDAGPLRARLARVRDAYAGLSAAYQAGKGGAGIPLA